MLLKPLRMHTFPHVVSIHQHEGLGLSTFPRLTCTVETCLTPCFNLGLNTFLDCAHCSLLQPRFNRGRGEPCSVSWNEKGIIVRSYRYTLSFIKCLAISGRKGGTLRVRFFSMASISLLRTSCYFKHYRHRVQCSFSDETN